LVSTPSAFGENAAGELFLASLSSGTVYQLTDTRKPGPVVGEADRTAVSQPNGRAWTKIKLRRRYRDPVIIAGPPTGNGAAPAIVRVRGVEQDSFELQLDEWQYTNGRHARESVAYLVVESGDHTLEDDTRLVAGSLAVNHRWRTVRFAQTFRKTPVVLVTVASRRNHTAVVERIDAVTEAGFRLRLQEEEAADGRHPFENVHWVAIEPGTGARHEVRGVAEVGTAMSMIPLGRGFNSRPIILADLQTHRGGDPASLRLSDTDVAAVTLWVEEEKSLDPETRHLLERVGIVALVRGRLRAQRNTP
jgi:hypothetical protein